MEPIVLEYIGKDNSYIIGVPAKNLTKSDIAAIGYTEEQLITTGLYCRVTSPADIEEV